VEEPAPASVPAVPHDTSQQQQQVNPFEVLEYIQARRIAQPKRRLKQSKVPAAAAAPTKAPAPVLPPAPAPAPTQQVDIPAAHVIPPETSLPALPSAGVNGQGHASMTHPEAEPAHEQFDFVVMRGENLRNLCQEWIKSCASLMEVSPLCSNLSPRWIRRWEQDTLVNLGKDLKDADQMEDDQEDAVSVVKRFFQYNLGRRMDGPVKDGQIAIMRHVKELAAKEGLDLGNVDR
jgi:hypothetical protein